MTRSSIGILASAGMAVVVLLSIEGCSRKSRDQFNTGVRLGKASKLCEKPDDSCTDCCSTYDATFVAQAGGGKCACVSSDATYSKTSGATQETAQRKVVGAFDVKLSMDLPVGYRVVKGLSIEPTNWAQARSDDGFGDRFVSVNGTKKGAYIDPFDKFVAARIVVLRRNVNDLSLTPGIRGTTPAGATMQYEITVAKQNARMLVTFLETQNYIHEIKAWSVASSFPSAKPQLAQMASLVREAP